MNIVRAFFFSKIRALFEKVQGDLPPLLPSSYAPGNINWFINRLFKNDVTGVGEEVREISDKK